ncbi:hypothetical protein [Rhizobium sp. NRK18]|uniref:hypothetical protein n=1 Tax=Rhizobium sp. NRK18 TaxID=2964667 RepID=UPI0021C359A5|nr:hypothetical protein [Rhizobium sp. NRK18]MCQ2005137.1 hypothetical protein [Rhizobium sp. NRK18]
MAEGVMDMLSLVKTINAAALMILFVDYAVAMQKVEPMGMRRCLRTMSKQVPTGAYPTLKPSWQPAVTVTDQVL